jgi:hypothetical protein
MSLQICHSAFGSFSVTGAGPRSQPLDGSKVGDIVFFITPTSGFSIGTPGGLNGDLEGIISVAGFIQQTSSRDLTSDNPITVVLLRPIHTVAFVTA